MNSRLEIKINHVNPSTGLIIALHPLVIMNISEHWTRIKAQENNPLQVIGAIIGKQIERNICILNSFEIRYDLINGIVVDKDYLKFKESHFKEVFSELEFLGWYTVGNETLITDISIHRQICDLYENPIMMKMIIDTKINDLPITMYESIIDFENGKAQMIFRELSYSLATEEAERVGLEHIANTNLCFGEISQDSLVNNQLIAQQNAIKMLNSRLLVVINYLKDVQNDKFPKKYELLREASSLLNRLPIYKDPNYDKEYLNENNDVALLTYLGEMTKTCDTINQFVNKFNCLQDKQAASRRIRGGLIC
ncbi:unnamed protein product [Gordionus sp. m RMFG-2023]|uniref:COP9 signalosome complex subunit 6-like isoform X2 n=1 Tax=Gordionus sp. m RMFG-2023 TaxID=3053472 RepID=UPI0030E0FFBD